MSHRQVSVAVRSFVDEELKELIELLSTFDNVCTFKSCQGGDGESANIFLYYGTEVCFLQDTWETHLALSVFAKMLADAISQVMEQIGGNKSALHYLRMSIVWGNPQQCPLFMLEMPSFMIAKITELFHEVKRVFDNSMIGKKDLSLRELLIELT